MVVNWNAGKNLIRCIDALLEASGRLDLEILVVDNASSDGSTDGLARFGACVRLVQTGGNLGFGRGVNKGVAESTRPYILALNPDVVLRPNALEAMVDFLERDLTVGLVGPTLLDASGRVRASCGSRPNLAAEVCRKFLLHLVFPFLKFRRRRPAIPNAVGWVTGACFLVRRQAFEAVDGLDRAIFMYYEDVDLCLRLTRAGWQIFYLPAATGVHLGGESSRQVLEQMLLVSENSYHYFIKKHFGPVAAGLLSVLTPVEMGLRMLLWGGLFVMFPGHRAEARTRLRAYRKILAGIQPPFHPEDASDFEEIV